ncbi:peroxiredoxin [Salinisphaera sp. T31B1]|uniref:peroxiredoxin n=1 Tax=Salinisphaera sp. T31B1 TaxID=727963 RepID=UPI003340902B
MSAHPDVGDRAPLIDHLDHRGQRVHTAPDGHAWVVYFYPRDGTPVCTRQACSFQDRLSELERLDARVVGVSADDAASHRDFADRHGLGFPLIADTAGQLSRAFDVGRALGVVSNRVTFVIDGQGIIRLRYQAQLAAGRHVDKAASVLADLDAG